MTHRICGLMLSAALMLAAQPAAADTPTGCSAANTEVAAPAAPRKKKGFGLGSLLKAANDAGVSDMLGGGMLGRGRFGQVAGAVAGTAISAAGGDGSDAASGMMGQFAGMAGSGRIGQVAGAVTGTAVALARSAPRGGTQAPAQTCPTELGAVVNLYR